MSELLFWTMIAAFFTHELDATKRHEWRVFPVMRFLPEKLGEQAFIWLHVPLFGAVLWYGQNGADTLFAMSVSAFAIVHVGLHWVFRNHPAYEFNNVSSWCLIGLTGLLGAAHLALVIF